MSVLETNAQGDISQGGRNQRPLAAKSVAAAGYFINRRVAEYLLFQRHPELRKHPVVRSCLERINRSDWSDPDPTLSLEAKAFIENFRKLVQRCERAKISICSNISNWSLNANLSAKVPYRVKVPDRPFLDQSPVSEISIDAATLRRIFEEEVWTRKLRPAVTNVIDRAKAELGGRPISLVLLSGGSSNIGWLRELLRRDLSMLHDAEILDLSDNYQEVVAKGLAVECARRYFTEGEGDFNSVLYNRLCLLLAPNGRELEIKRFRPVAPPDLAETMEEGVLLPSAAGLRNRINQEMRWKVKLSSQPSQNLHYYFMRSSFDPEDLEGALNIIERSVVTPKSARFGQWIEVSLQVREDGTAIPTFIYGKGKGDGETAVEGQPFFLDMTSTAMPTSIASYIGFDFGSSTSSFSLVSQSDVVVYRQRSESSEWRELSDLVGALPYPVAAPLARYISETSREGSFKRGRAAFEASLAFLAYCIYAEFRISASRRQTSLFKGFAHRSAGPMWSLLRDLKNNVSSSAPSFRVLTALFDGNYDVLNTAVSAVAKEKHDKVVDIDFNRTLRTICVTVR